MPKSTVPAPNSSNGGFGCQVVSKTNPSSELGDRGTGAVDDFVADEQDHGDREQRRQGADAEEQAVAEAVERAPPIAAARLSPGRSAGWSSGWPRCSSPRSVDEHGPHFTLPRSIFTKLTQVQFGVFTTCQQVTVSSFTYLKHVSFHTIETTVTAAGEILPVAKA